MPTPQLTFQKIKPNGEDYGKPMLVKYAPAELTFAKSAQYAEVAIPGLELPLQQFVRGDATTLTMDLFFDSTDSGTGAGAVAVTEQVEEFHRLVTIDGALHSPPLVRITWGDNFPGAKFGNADQGATSEQAQQNSAQSAAKVFTAIVLSVSRRFTLFNPDGRPLRAIVSISLKQFATIEQQVTALNYQSADHTRLHVVQEGETLPLIAYDAYGDSRKWRVIATHNEIAEPRLLAPGTALELPPLA
jgi:nucleoid-associated protein YgaU